MSLLTPGVQEAACGVMGTLKAISPLTFTVRGQDVRRGLLTPAGMGFRVEEIGETYALLPCEGGLLILMKVREVT